MKRVLRGKGRRGSLLLGLVLSVGVLGVVLGGGAGPAIGAKSYKMTLIQQKDLSGLASFELSAGLGGTEANANAKPLKLSRASGQRAGSSFSVGCPTDLGTNIQVNQNCLNLSDPDLQGRGQAQNETGIAQDPNQPSRIVGSYNDYRRGDGTCGVSLSNGGAQWQDATTPNNFVRGGTFGGAAREYFQAGGDTAVAWDTKDNAYLLCMMFQRGVPTTNNTDASSGIYVFRSTGTNGGSWNFPGRPVAEVFTRAASQLPLLDKPYMTIDNHPGSPFKDRIYVSWVKYGTDGSVRLYEAYSSDYGESFSSPVLIGGRSPLCPNGITGPNRCDNSDFPQPFTAPDGTVYVVFKNANNTQANKADNHNQILIAKSTDGGATFGPLVKVADFNDLPDCATYQGGQDPFRACVPEKGSNMDSVFRATNYPVGAVNPTNPKRIVVTVASYINRDSNPNNGCVPEGVDPNTLQNLFRGVKTAGACNNKIVYSVSSDSGNTFTGTTRPVEGLPVVNQDPGQTRTDQFWQWAAFNSAGKLAVSYFDRQYGNDETTGASDISLSASSGLGSFATTRVTTSSMPPPTQFPDAQGNSLFYGDYSGLSVSNDTAHPLWMDTRTVDLFLCPGTAAQGVPPFICTGTEPDGDLANDQNIYTASVPLP